MRWKLAIPALILVLAIPVIDVIYYKFNPELLAKLSFYIDLANPSMRIVRVQEGLRKEEVAESVLQRKDGNVEDRMASIEQALDGMGTAGKFSPLGEVTRAHSC